MEKETLKSEDLVANVLLFNAGHVRSGLATRGDEQAMETVPCAAAPRCSASRWPRFSKRLALLPVFRGIGDVTLESFACCGLQPAGDHTCRIKNISNAKKHFWPGMYI